jgi:double-stranded uracil-DNA glycosylase
MFMIKYQIGYGLKIVFVGINPHPGSAQRGIPFSNNKMFWYLLHDAGLLPEPRELLKDDAYLRNLYLNFFKKVYHFGLLNIANRATKTANVITRAESVAGAEHVRRDIERYKPLVVCFVGKVTYDRFIGSSKISYGWQSDIGVSKVYVMHAPHRGLASVRIKELKEINRVATRQK